MFFDKPVTTTPTTAAETPATPARRKKPTRKRNRQDERRRREARNYKFELLCEATALHHQADDEKLDDPEAGFDWDIPTTNPTRIKARVLEQIADGMSKKLRL